MQRNSPVMLATIVLGVLALGATAFLVLGPKGGSTPPPTALAQAVVPTPTPSAHWVASRDIPPRTVVVPAMMRRDYSSGAVPAGAVQSLDDLAGQITREPIGAGETVRLASFTPRLRRAIDANIQIPTGYRGVAIWVDPDQTAAGLVDVGDRIDVVATHRLTQPGTTKEQYVVGAITFSAGRTIAQDLLVLGVDKSIKAPAPTPTPAPGAPAAGGGVPAGGDGAPATAVAPTPVPPPTLGGTRTRVLVAALPETAARLVAANDQGVLHITIRNPSDGDAGLVPEAREYPSRMVRVAPQVNPTVAAAERGLRSMERATQNMTRQPQPMPELPPIQPVMPVSPPPMTSPPTTVPRADNPGGTGMTSPEAMAGKEITVIRGTEKTRVIVPQR